MNKHVIIFPNIFTIKEFNSLQLDNFNSNINYKINNVIYLSLRNNNCLIPEKYSLYEKYKNNLKITNNNDILDDMKSFKHIWKYYLNLNDQLLNISCIHSNNSSNIPVTLDNGCSFLINNDYNVSIPDENSYFIDKFVF